MERNEFIEGVYKNITNNMPVFNYSHMWGKEAVFSGFNANYNVDILAKLLKTPSGKITSLKLDSGFPIVTSSDKEDEKKVLLKTNIRFLDSTVKNIQDEIDYAIELQKDAKDLIEKKEQIIKNAACAYNDMESEDRTAYRMGNLKLSFQPNLKKPFLKIIGDHYPNNTSIQATSKKIEDISLLLKPLEYQIKNLEYANKL